MKKIIIQVLKILIVSILSSFTIGYVFAAWTGPTAAPPGDNADAPINVGPTAQTKSGDFILDTGATFTSPTGIFNNVGIGTTIPQAPLTVMQTVGGLTTGLQFGGQYVPGVSSGGTINSFDSNGITVRPLTLQNNGGKVGINTTRPLRALDVNGLIRSSGDHIINNGAPTIYFQDNDRSAMIHVNSRGMYFLRGCGPDSLVWCPFAGYWPLVIDLENNAATFGGDLRIPRGALNVSGPVLINSTFEIRADNLDNSIRFHDPGNAWYSVGIDQSDGNKFKINYGGNVGDINQFVMTTDGRVGIGAVPGSQRLQVSGAGVGIQGNGGNLGVRGDGSSVGVLGTSPNIGVWGDGISFDFYASGPGTNYGSNSSIRWKNNIEPIENALDKILSLRGVYYDWDEEHGGQHGMGMIAEEVGEIIPEIVGFEEDSEYAIGLDYGALTPVLVEAIKEQQKIIETLKEEVENLKNK